MGNPSRRNFLKFAAAAGTGGLYKRSEAGPVNILSEERMGVLVDTTVCIGCRKCEYACKMAHDIPTDSIDSYEDQTVFNKMRRPDNDALTVVNAYTNKPSVNIPITVKVQCMHCDRPACVSACIVGALSKQKNGRVIWDGSKCIGCRYCLVACPFQIPTFEYHKAIQPRVMKCDFCYERSLHNDIPACVEICPVEALVYGKRSELIEIAHDRIARFPERYIDHIYGEKEVGGTSWLYLAAKDFNSLDFPKLGNKEAPGVSESIQHGIFAYFVPPVLLYALLGGVMWISKNQSEEA
jgi:formate dehydrogenase iron-sulfur subunit